MGTMLSHDWKRHSKDKKDSRTYWHHCSTCLVFNSMLFSIFSFWVCQFSLPFDYGQAYFIQNLPHVSPWFALDFNTEKLLKHSALHIFPYHCIWFSLTATRVSIQKSISYWYFHGKFCAGCHIFQQTPLPAALQVALNHEENSFIWMTFVGKLEDYSANLTSNFAQEVVLVSDHMQLPIQ